MSFTSTRHSALELFGEISDLLVGLGLITFVLFPFALPIILLTIFVLVILAIPALLLGLVSMVVVSPVLLMMRLRRRRRDRLAPPTPRAPSAREIRYVSSPAPRSAA